MMFGRFWLKVSGSEPYLYSLFITALALYGMYAGKLDYNMGLGIIATMGLGSTIHMGVSNVVANAVAPTPPSPGGQP